MQIDERIASVIVPHMAALIDADLKRRQIVSDSWASLSALDAQVAALQTPGGILASAGLTEIGDLTQRAKFEEAFVQAAAFAKLLGVQAPVAAAFTHAGVDFVRLSEVAASDDSLRLTLAPHGLGAQVWITAFEKIAVKYSEVFDAGTPLEFASEVLAGFALLDRVPVGAPTCAIAGVEWSLRLIPAAAKPAVMGLNYAKGPHPSLPEMLMLQATLVLAGADPLDKNTFTWLEGTIADDRLAARHVFDVSGKRIIINSREIGNQGPHMGARHPRV